LKVQFERQPPPPGPALGHARPQEEIPGVGVVEIIPGVGIVEEIPCVGIVERIPGVGTGWFVFCTESEF
jgi:hypothetical protein